MSLLKFSNFTKTSHLTRRKLTTGINEYRRSFVLQKITVVYKIVMYTIYGVSKLWKNTVIGCINKKNPLSGLKAVCILIGKWYNIKKRWGRYLCKCPTTRDLLVYECPTNGSPNFFVNLDLCLTKKCVDFLAVDDSPTFNAFKVHCTNPWVSFLVFFFTAFATLFGKLYSVFLYPIGVVKFTFTVRILY